jgi:hypothetical protein
MEIPMSIDINAETLLTPTEAAKRLPNRPHTSSIWRWCRRGVRGVRLEYVRVGSKIFTTSAALNRLVNALAAADEHQSATAIPTTKPSTPAAREKSIQRACELLNREGI